MQNYCVFTEINDYYNLKMISIWFLNGIQAKGLLKYIYILQYIFQYIYNKYTNKNGDILTTSSTNKHPCYFSPL